MDSQIELLCHRNEVVPLPEFFQQGNQIGFRELFAPQLKAMQIVACCKFSGFIRIYQLPISSYHPGGDLTV